VSAGAARPGTRGTVFCIRVLTDEYVEPLGADPGLYIGGYLHRVSAALNMVNGVGVVKFQFHVRSDDSQVVWVAHATEANT